MSPSQHRLLNKPTKTGKEQHHKISPLRHIDRTRNPATELDSSPRGTLLRGRHSVLSETIYELDSSVNEGTTISTATHESSSDPLNPNFRGAPTSSPTSQRDDSRIGDLSWQSTEKDTMSNVSSAMSGGIRLARSGGELSARSD
jgi:hypothetical protein